MGTLDIAAIRRKHADADDRQREAWNFEEAATTVFNFLEDALGVLTGDERFDRIASLMNDAHTQVNELVREAEIEAHDATVEFDEIDAELGRIEDAIEMQGESDLRKQYAIAVLDEGYTGQWLDWLSARNAIEMVDITQPAFVRMRGQEWSLKPEDARILEAAGFIARDYDCERNTFDNGKVLGPCYGVVGDSESEEESLHAKVVAELSMVS